MTTEIVLTGSGLTCAQVRSIAYGEARVALGSLGAARASNICASSHDGPLYGRTTGVGANASIQVADAGLALLRSHAGGAGPLIGAERARGMLAVRLNQLIGGGSGADPGLATALAEAINGGHVPPVREYGAIGTGDLTALSSTALCLLGEVGWTGPRFPLASRDALPFISSGALTLAGAAIACADLMRLAGASIAVAAESWRAAGASAQPLAAEVGAARPHPGQSRVAARMRELTGSARSPRLQDPYGFRAFPQVHGAALDVLGSATKSIELDLNAAAENPLIRGGVWHNGNFHSAPVALALDALRPALVQTATLSAARLTALLDTGEHPFKAGRAGGSGLLILEYVAQDALATLRHLAAPVTTGSVVISRGAEDHAGFATQAARACLAMREPYEIVLACELVAARHEPGPDAAVDVEGARRALNGLSQAPSG